MARTDLGELTPTVDGSQSASAVNGTPSIGEDLATTVTDGTRADAIDLRVNGCAMTRSVDAGGRAGTSGTTTAVPVENPISAGNPSTPEA